MEGLLNTFRRLKLGPEIVKRFHLMGGECNYLLRINPTTYGLEFVADEVRGVCVSVCVVNL
jgi:IMP and pyridine-specific 5'-nucleotidase